MNQNANDEFVRLKHPRKEAGAAARTRLQHQFFSDEKSMVGKVKHAILTSYLGAWFAKLSQNPWRTKGWRYTESNPEYNKLVYIDGFAGTGSYGNEEYGSPTLAYRLALEHRSVPEDGPEIVLIFIEKDPENCYELLCNLRRMRKELRNAKNAKKVRYMVINDTFVSAMKWIMSSGFDIPGDSRKNIYVAPTERPRTFHFAEKFLTPTTPVFTFVDPFGYNGAMMPMKLMRKIIRISQKSEIFINIMTGSIQRFLKLDSRTRPINLLAGIDEFDSSWKEEILLGETSAERTEIFLDFYLNNLSEAVEVGKLYCPRFEMRGERNRLKYHLCFATRHPKSLDSMKIAMTRMTHREGEFKFSGFIETRGDDRPEQNSAHRLRDLILMTFEGKRKVDAEEINYFILHQTWFVQKFRRQLKKLLKDYRIGDLSTNKFDKMSFSFRHISLPHQTDNDLVEYVARTRRNLDRRPNSVLWKINQDRRTRRIY